MENQEKLLQFGFRILEAERNAILMDHPFLSRALYELKPAGMQFSPIEEMVQPARCATDGKQFLFDPTWLVQAYLQQGDRTRRVYLHSVFHCLYLHPFFARTHTDIRLWDLACDICVWNVLQGLSPITLDNSSETERMEVARQLEQELKNLSAQNIYRCLSRMRTRKGDQAEEELLLWRQLFAEDDHFLWHQKENLEKEAANSQAGENGEGGEENENGEDREVGRENKDSGNGGDTGNSVNYGDGEDSGVENTQQVKLLQTWSDIADHVEVSLEAEIHNRGKEPGEQAGNLLESIRGIEREHIDYAAFLRKFAVLEERMMVDLDSFDYNYYTYGLELYHDMPLIEPLEFKELHTIRDFVIALDTSGSCDRELIRKFLTKTYDILSERQTFSDECNVHILQCDACIQEDVCIHNQKELTEYITNLTIKGRGGTDFRPVFEAVERLRENGKLPHLRGLLYFTDGYGIFPKTPTDYKTAFVFAEPEDAVLVPPWAMKVLIEEENL